MSTVPDWWEGRQRLSDALGLLQAHGCPEAAATVQWVQAIYDTIYRYASGDLAIFEITRYQLDNLTQFLAAIPERPESRLGAWNTGDWWGELLATCQQLGGRKGGGNPPLNTERTAS